MKKQSRTITKTLNVTFFMLFCLMGLLCPVNIHAQKVTLPTKSQTVRQVMNSIEKQTGYKFFYNNTQIDLNRKVTISAKKEPLSQVLSQLFAGTNISYKLMDKNIVLSKNDVNKINEQQGKTGSSGQHQIKGKITDSKGEPIIGATVKEVGTNNATVTNIDGEFDLNASNQNAELEISYIGYSPLVTKAKAGSSNHFTLAEDTEMLDEVVVVAYGTQKKSNITGSVDIVKAKDLENRPVTSASAMLQGKVSSITFSTPSGGNTPGSNPTLQIRGQAALDTTTPPLVVIDGIPSDMGAFNALNPNDIESISVLKDAASSAVYGARAPYGVLVVATKMGKRNEKTTISYSGNYAIVTPVNMPKSLDSYTFAVIRNQSYLNSRMQPIFNDEELDLIKDNIDNPGKYTLSDLVSSEGNIWGKSYVNTDWMDVILKSSFRHQHDLSLKGGGKKSSYTVSVGYVYQPGNLNFVENMDNYTRFNVSSGINADVTSWLKVTYRNRYAYTITKEPTCEYAGGRQRMYDFLYGAWPTYSLYMPDGSYLGIIATSKGGGMRKYVGHRLDNILAFDFNLAKGWTAHIDGTWRMNFSDNQTLRKPVYGTYPSGDEYLINGTESSIAKSAANNNYWTIQGYSVYEQKIKEHYFRIQLGAQVEENNYRSLSGTAKDLFIYDMASAHIAQGI